MQSFVKGPSQGLRATYLHRLLVEAGKKNKLAVPSIVGMRK